LRIARAVFLAITAIFLHGTAFHAWSISPTDVLSAEELKMSTKKRMLAAAVGGVVLSGASSAHAQDAVQWRVEDGGNGHWYQLRIVGPIEWPDATIDAVTHGGHLATIASEMENSFVVALASVGPGWVQNYGPWLGGFQNPLAADYSEPRGGWRWWDGESIEWAQWDVKGADEPNNCWCNCGSEDFLHLKASEILGASAVWNDINGSSATGCVQPISYMLEYSADCNSDGLVDYGQIRAGELVDTNANNIPDCCEQAISCVPCAADIDESGAVNSVDLAAVLSNWGSDGGKYPRADIDGDGTVSSTDLAAVLSAWGPCE
jgi:hypothetical protein